MSQTDLTLSPAVPNLRHLQLLCEVMHCGSASAAARAVHLSQPAVTQAIGALEQAFGAPLFHRTSLGMKPTGAGELCQRRIERTLEQVRDGIAEARRSRAKADTDPVRRITTAQLEALIAVVEHRGFGAAARALGLSRPTLHRAARDLERILGVALFERTSFGVEATREAVELARRLQLAFAEIEQARAEISALAGGDRGRTVIGAMPLARSFFVPQTVLEFAAEYPGHTIELLDGPYEGMLEALRRGRADVLVGALREPAPFGDIVQEHLFDDPLAVVVRAGHPLARRKRPDLEDLARFPWIAPRRGSPLRRQFDDLYRSLGDSPARAPIECNSLVAARAMLLASDRLMLLSAHQVRRELATQELTTLPHPAGPVVRRIGLTQRRDWQPTAAQEALLARLRAKAALAAMV